MMKIIEYVLSGVLMSSFYLYTTSVLTKNKINWKDKRVYINCFILAIAMFLNFYYNNSNLKVLMVTVMNTIFTYFTVKKNIKESVLTALFYQIILIISEMIFTIIVTLIFGNSVQTIFDKYCGVLAINIIIVLICYFFITKKVIIKLYEYFLDMVSKISEIIAITLLSLVIISIGIMLPLIYYKMNIVLFTILNSILTGLYMFIIIKIINEKNKYIEVNEKYNLTEKSLESVQEVVDVLRISGHENKNQLLIIRNMIKNKDAATIKYIDTLLDNKIKDDERLLLDVNTITNSSISAIIYSKILFMKNRDINVTFHIDKLIKKENLSTMSERTTVNICKILGVLLDNAIEAVENLKKKEIGVYLYIDENSKLNIEISNNYKGEICLDKIENHGYTTKGEGRGYGLALVRTIINTNNNLSLSTALQGNIFKQIITVEKY